MSKETVPCGPNPQVQKLANACALLPRMAAALGSNRRRIRLRSRALIASMALKQPTASDSGTEVDSERQLLCFGLQDKIAIVTGASQGIGRAIALGLAHAGAHLVLAKHPEGRQDEIKQVQSEIEQMGRRASSS